MKWCNSCVLPDTRPNLFIQDNGICNACNLHRSKIKVNWKERKENFERIINQVKRKSLGYDCLIPVSGGKDSTWQTLKCLSYGLKPLAVTWKTPGRTEIGKKNLENLINLGVDHIDFQINPKFEAKFMVETFKKFGSTAIPMHLALFNIPLTIAVKFKIPIIIWGENSAFEYGSKTNTDTGFELNKNWLKTYGVTHGTTAKDWICDELSEKDLKPYFGPTSEEIKKSKVKGMFLGYFFQWDPIKINNIVSKNGFSSVKNAKVGYYNFADIDDDFISLHHWMKWYKFGFTRTFDNLSLEIRNNRLTRQEAIKLLKSHHETPIEDIKRFCKFAKITVDLFFKYAEKFRNKNIWTKNKNNVWYIPSFIVKDWNWT